MFSMKGILLNPEAKEAAQQLVQVRTKEITEEVVSEVLKLKPFGKVSADYIDQETKFYDFIQTKIDAAYRLGAKDGSCAVSFLITQ